jgi:hypothetical protein
LANNLGILHTTLDQPAVKIISAYSWHFCFAVANKRDAGHKYPILRLFGWCCDAQATSS